MVEDGVSDHAAVLRRVADSLAECDYDTWGFGDSIGFEGLVAASDVLGDTTWLSFARGWVRAWASDQRPPRRLDCTAPGHAMLAIYRRVGDEHILVAARRLAEYLVERPRLASGIFATWDASPLTNPYGPGRLDDHGRRMLEDPPAGAFVDCLHFDPPFLVDLGVTTGSDAFVRVGLDQARRYIDVLQQPDGLFDHFELAGERGTFGPGWGRGQGWALLGLTDVLRLLASTPWEAGDDAHALRGATARLVERMTALQRPDGHWGVDVRDPLSGDEYSTAAFMAVGFRRAVDLGVVTATDATAARTLSETAVLSSLTPEGTLRNVSAAVMACTEPSHYRHVPLGFRVPWGQGPVALVLAEREAEWKREQSV